MIPIFRNSSEHTGKNKSLPLIKRNNINKWVLIPHEGAVKLCNNSGYTEHYDISLWCLLYILWKVVGARNKYFQQKKKKVLHVECWLLPEIINKNPILTSAYIDLSKLSDITEGKSSWFRVLSKLIIAVLWYGGHNVCSEAMESCLAAQSWAVWPPSSYHCILQLPDSCKSLRERMGHPSLSPAGRVQGWW